VLSIGQYYLERRFSRGATRELPETPLQRLRRNLFVLRSGTQEAPAASGERR
jgi:polar amino acid transport system permease protein